MKSFVKAVMAALKKLNQQSVSKPTTRYIRPAVEDLEGRLAPSTFLSAACALPPGPCMPAAVYLPPGPC
jgi:hypothetical protein